MTMPIKSTPAKKPAKKTAAKKASSSAKRLPKIKDLEAVANRVGASKKPGKKSGFSSASLAKFSAGQTPVIDLVKVWKNYVKWYQKQIGRK